VEHDAVRDLAHRLQTSPGLGYYVVQNPRHSLAMESGLMYRSESQGDTTSDEWGGRFSERYTYKFNTKSRLWYNTEVSPEFADYDYILIAEMGVETPMTEDLNLRFVARDVYDSAVDADAERNELILRASLVWSVMK